MTPLEELEIDLTLSRVVRVGESTLHGSMKDSYDDLTILLYALPPLLVEARVVSNVYTGHVGRKIARLLVEVDVIVIESLDDRTDGILAVEIVDEAVVVPESDVGRGNVCE